MFGLSNVVIYIVGAVVAAGASAVIGWNVLKSRPDPRPLPPAVVEASKPAPPAASPSAPAGPIKPQFDVVRVEPSGDTVAAGRAEANSIVTLFAGDRAVATATADAAGQFVMTPPELPPGDHVLSLRAKSGDAEVASDQTVAVAVPQSGSGAVVVALAEPDKPTRVLSDAKPVASPAAAPAVTIRTVEAQRNGGFFVTGGAASGTQVRLYLSDSFIAAAQPADDGRWSVTVERGMSPGRYAVRADLVDADGKVMARAEVPFDYRAPVVAAAPAPANQPARADAVVGDLRTARVERGDSLWRISRTLLGRGQRYTQIYDANTAQIRDPRRIYPGQILVVPQSGL